MGEELEVRGARQQGDVIEVVYYRHFVVYVEVFDTVEEALAYIDSGEGQGNLSSVGVFRNAEPIIVDGYVDQKPPSLAQAAQMREAYREANRD